MINKEIILNADGSIYKDFLDRNIPQYQNNQVSVNVLIPSACFTGLENYAVLLGVSRTISGVETTLNTLIMTASKSITIDDVLYVKYSAILSYSYTDKISTLKVSPYIQTTATTTINNVSTEVISIQQSFTNSNLNVIKSVLPQYDASLEEGTTATTLATQIAAKKFYSYDDASASNWGQHYYNIAANYNPSTSQFRPALVMSRYDGKNRGYILNGTILPSLIEIAEDGLIYKIDNLIYNSGTNTYTYRRTQISYKQSEVDAFISNLQSQINDMQDGSVEGSLQDQINDMKDGSQSGSLQYQINTLFNTKVNKTTRINGHELSGNINITKADVGLGNVNNYSVERYAPSASGSQLYITSKAVYDALTSLNTTLQNAIDGKASVSDFNDLDARLDAIETLIGENDGDDDNIINTLKEVISSLSGLGEDANILSMINSKANQTDFTALNNQINGENGIKDKVDILSERTNAYTEIKNSVGTIDILTTDWGENSDEDYPYKWELTNGYLIGATNAIVVFSVDSDTSLISSTIDIDEENGKVIIYASDLPSDTISIEKIAVFNDLNAYINYSNTIVQKTMQNEAAIQEINNVKLPSYVFKTNDKGNIINESNEVAMSIISSLTNINGISVKSDEINIGHFSLPFWRTCVNITDGNILFTATNLQWKTAYNGTPKTLATLDDIPSLLNHILTTNTQPTTLNGTITIDTTYIIENVEAKQGDYIAYLVSGNIKTMYEIVSISSDIATLRLIGNINSSGGGGSQLYQHNIGCEVSILNGNQEQVGKIEFTAFLINDDDTEIDSLTELKRQLNKDMDSTYLSNYIQASGKYEISLSGYVKSELIEYIEYGNQDDANKIEIYMRELSIVNSVIKMGNSEGRELYDTGVSYTMLGTNTLENEVDIWDTVIAK